MNETFTGMIIATVTLCFSFCAQIVLAATHTVGDYTLTVTARTPLVTPDPPRIDKDISVSFSLDIVEKTNDREENARGKVKQAKYNLTVGGEQITIKTASGFSVAQNKLSATKTLQALRVTQSAVVLAQKPGDKTVTLSVSVTLEDGTNLSASETVAFKVPDFYFAVFVRDADNYEDSKTNGTVAV